MNKPARRSGPSTSWLPAPCRRVFPPSKSRASIIWDGGIASNTPLDYVLEEDTTDDLLIFQVDLFSARGLLPTTMMEAAEREKDIRFSSRTRMNTDKNKKIHNTRKALRELIAKLPEDLKNDPSVAILTRRRRKTPSRWCT